MGAERRRLLATLAAAAVVLAAPITAGQVREVQAATPSAAEWHGEIDLQTRLKDVVVEREGDQLAIEMPSPAGPVRLTPDEFLGRLERAHDFQRRHGFVFKLFNITTPWGFLWVSVGFLGQILFTGRMVLQWIASERERRSVIPVGFWWSSLGGGAMLLVYFIWRKDIIGVIGQSTGAFIYARNLVLIYRGGPTQTKA